VPYWQLFYHLVWSTKDRKLFLTQEVEPLVHDVLRRKSRQLGATVFALNGVEDHVHLLVSIPPSLSVARFVGQVKAVASTLVNKARPEDHFAWQAEYGAFSFDLKRLPHHIDYVERQKEHHRSGSLIHALERSEEVAARSSSSSFRPALAQLES
jgi:putative transposase